MSITSNLYPPIVETLQPGFIRTDECRVHFALSAQNNIESIKAAQIAVVNQRTNKNALLKSLQPTGIKRTAIYQDAAWPGTDKYYIVLSGTDIADESAPGPAPTTIFDFANQINNSTIDVAALIDENNHINITSLLQEQGGSAGSFDLTDLLINDVVDFSSIDNGSDIFDLTAFELIETSEFPLNTYYKVQIRFDDIEAEISSPTAAWLTENLEHFSEWSTITLIRTVSSNNIQLTGFEETPVEFQHGLSQISGKLSFRDQDEKDYLQSYQITIKQGSTVVEQSAIIYTNPQASAQNEILYTLRTNLQRETNQQIQLSYTTYSGYKSENQFEFSIAASVIPQFEASIAATADDELGRIKLMITDINPAFDGQLILNRASAEDGYTIWTPLHKVAITNIDTSYNWFDITATSGIQYKQSVQKLEDGDLSDMIISNVVMQDLMDDFLFGANGEFLRIRFDANIDNFTINQADLEKETIGNQYITTLRNGNLYYKSFTIGGLITKYCNIADNGETQTDTGCGDHYDIYAERTFRDFVMKFLHDGKPKLFKSATEGNILVRLMKPSQSANKTLKRMLYSFSAKANEIGECSTANLDKWNIQKLQGG